MASRTHVLYTGFTSGLSRRVLQHKAHKFDGFSAVYCCERLVYFERFSEPSLAIAREKQIKRWRWQKKVMLIEKKNPTWQDLSESWFPAVEAMPLRPEVKA